MLRVRDWHSKVYKAVDASYPDDWDIIREAVLVRDRFKCLRCDRHFVKSQLSVHHMMPRDEGGSNDMTNLVTLCHECHDYVEIHEHKTRAAIMGSMDEERREIADLEKRMDDKRPEWHALVYGCRRRKRR